jgi:ligand-binding sensor domain-containing protein
MAVPTVTETPKATATPTQTPTPTPVPAPQGVWSEYWNSNEILEIHVDGQGYLWGMGVGSIIRWDASEGTYQEFGLAQGLPANFTSEMFIGPQGKVWLSFGGGGLWRFDDPDWTAFVELDGIEGERMIAHGNGRNGVLWICTNEGFSRFDGEQWYSVKQDGGLDDDLCAYLTVDHQGNLWMQGSLGITSFVDGQVEYQEFDIEMDYSSPIGAHTAPNGDLWFAYGREHVIQYDVSMDSWHAERKRPKAFTLASNGQPWLIDDWGGGLLSENNLQTFEYGTHVVGDFASGENLQIVMGYRWHLPFHEEAPKYLRDIFSGVNGEIWITGTDGLTHIRGSNLEIIPSGYINDLVAFGPGKAYLSNFPNGLSIIRGQEFEELRAQSLLFTNSIRQLVAGQDGTIWIGGVNGLQSYDGQSWVMHELPNDYIYDLAVAPNGDIWASYGNKGFGRLNSSVWEIFARGDVDELPAATIERISIAADGTIWLAMADSGIASFDGTNWDYSPFPSDQIPERIRALVIGSDGSPMLAADELFYVLEGDTWSVYDMQVEIQSLLVGPQGAIWAGTNTEGLYQIHNGDLVPTNYPADRVSALELAPDGSIWAGSLSGAWRFDGYEWFNYTEVDGLRSNYVRAIAAGPDNTIWFSAAGLTRFGPP